MRAARHVFSLAPLAGDGPVRQGGRVNPIPVRRADGANVVAGVQGTGEFGYADDMITMPLQCATQWDSLAHVHYGGKLYNGHPASTLTPAGASRNGIDKMREGIVSRGVLLDVARAHGVERLRPGQVIGPAESRPPSARRCASSRATCC